jgi:hypothetical protein
MKAPATLLALAALVSVCFAGTLSKLAVTGQILAYQGGYLFFTTGDGFRVERSATFKDAKTGGATQLRPAPQLWAHAKFDASGEISEIDLSRTALSPIGDFAAVRQFAVAISSPVPNPDLEHPVTTAGGLTQTYSGKPVVVVFEVQVPPTTPLDALVYMTTDVSGWNPQAVPMHRVDALHFEVVERLRSGTVLHFLYTRGSFASEERTEAGLEEKPRTATVADVDGQVYSSIVYRWADQSGSGQALQQPNVFPTPYNPAPFPNLPPGIHTPQPLNER